MTDNDYTAPELGELTPTAAQDEVIEYALWLLYDMGVIRKPAPRGSGQSTLRALLAQAILRDEEYASYKVIPIPWKERIE